MKILHEDDTLLVVDKPAGWAIETVADELRKQFPMLEDLGEQKRYGIVHRLDKDTSGILLVAKTKEEFEQLQKHFAERQVEKRYICLVEGDVKQDTGSIHTLLGRSPADRRKQRAYPLNEPFDSAQGKRDATTQWRVLKRFENYTLLEVQPRTGRKHQIRAHMASIGHPIAGDKLYGFKNQQIPQDLNRQFLHASFLKISPKEFISPLPEDLQKVLEKLSLHNDDSP